MLYKENFTLQTKPTTEKAKYGVECYVTTLGEVYKQTTMPIGSSWVYVAHRELKTSDVVETPTKKYNQTSNKNIADADLGEDPETGQPFLQNLFTAEQIFDNDGTKSYKITVDKKGRVKSISQVTVSGGGGGYTDEQAQDAVGTILDDGTFGDIAFTYDDTGNLISGEIIKVGGTAITLTGASLMTIANISALVTALGLVANDITNATTAGKSILTAANIDAVVTLLALISTDITDSTTVGQSLLTAVSAAAARSAISAQLTDADLDAIAALSPANNDFLQRKAGAWTNRTINNVQNDLTISVYSNKRSGKWYHQGRNATAIGSSAAINNTSTVSMSLLEIGTTTVITDIAVEVTTALAGALLYFGIYRIDTPAWNTGPLVASAAGVSGATNGVKSVTLASPVSLIPALYLIAVSHNGVGSVTFRNVGLTAMALMGTNIPGVVQTSMYLGARASGGALPANLSGFTSITETINTVAPILWHKVQ